MTENLNNEAVADGESTSVEMDGQGYTLEEAKALASSAANVANLHVARAWIDRWEALGGYFGFIYDQSGSPKSLTRGMLCGADLWTPTDEGRADLAPHTWLVRAEDHSGAVRALEGLLELCPDLHEAVREVAGRKCLARWAKGEEQPA